MRRSATLACALGTALWWGPFAEARADTCRLEGTVLDLQGEGVEDLRIQAIDGERKLEASTDERGHFVFANIETSKPLRVVVWLSSTSAARPFAIWGAGKPASLVTETFTPATRDCKVEFDARSLSSSYALRGIPDAGWGDALVLFSEARRATSLAERLGVQWTHPVAIEAWDATASPELAAWVGPFSYAPEERFEPGITLGTAASRRNDPGAPDNRLFHEFGHQVLAAGLGGALPRDRQGTPFGGYYENPSTTDSWSEGFAVFFATQVAAKVLQSPRPSLYRLEGAQLDIEADYQPWNGPLGESLAVAGLLLDLVDAATPAGPALDGTIEGHLSSDGSLVWGRLDPASHPATLEVTWGSTSSQTTSVEVVGEVYWVAPVPEDAGSDFTVRGWRGTAEIPDDDPVSIRLVDLWQAIVRWRSEEPGPQDELRRVETLVDLRQALQSLELDPKQLDALFVAHGFFADEDGDRQHDEGEAVGPTSHPARTFEGAGGPIQVRAMTERARLPLPESFKADVTTDPSSASLIVHTAHRNTPARSYAREAPRDEEGWIPVAVPPSDATVTLIAMAPGRPPTLVTRVEAEQFWQEAGTGTTKFLSGEAQVEASKPALTRAPWFAPAIFGAGVVFVLGGLLAMATARTRS